MKTIREFIYGATYGLLFGLILIKCVEAGELPVVQLNQDAVGYATMDEAAVAALRPLVKGQPSVEHGGAIYKCAGYFYTSNAVTQNRKHKLSYTISRYKECELVATFHTHPAHDRRSENFSKEDVQMAKTLNVVTYIGVCYSGNIRKLENDFQSLVTIIAVPLI